MNHPKTSKVTIIVSLMLLISLMNLGNLSIVEASANQVEIQEEMLEAINEARAEGVTDNDGVWHPPVPHLRWNEKLEAAALRHSEDMHENNFIAHTGSDGSTPWERIEEAGYTFQIASENVAKGHRSVEAVMSDWLGSPGHCANIMNEDVIEVGAARVGDSWTQVFALPESFDPRIEVNRLHGSHRYETAIKISQAAFSDTAEAVVLATGLEFPDALAGVPLAYEKGGPLLLTRSDKLTDETAHEIDRLLKEGDTVYVLGGEAAVSEEVADELYYMDFEVERLEGEGRFDTAVRIAEEVTGNPEEVFLTTGLDFPDAVAASGPAAMRGAPILLTTPDELSEETESYLAENEESIENIHVIGGETAVSDEVMEVAGGTNRVSGAGRWETGIAIAEEFFPEPETATLATGLEFPDALAGGVYAALNDAPVLLTNYDELPEEVEDYFIGEEGIMNVSVFGGDGAVSDSVLRAIQYIDT